jgi:hypothetical protein
VTNPIARRGLLISGGLAVLGVAGCRAGSDPLPSASSRATASGTSGAVPAPTPLPGTVEAAEQESDLVRYAATALQRLGPDLDASERRLLGRIRDTHRLHAAALMSRDPLDGGSASAAPSPSPSSASPSTGSSAASVPSRPSAMIKKLATYESRLADRHRARALHPAGPSDQQGRLALLWASLCAAAETCAAACADRDDPVSGLVGDHRRPVDLPEATGAVQQVVAQCHAMIFGYQAAIPRLSGARGAQAADELARYRALRDALSARLDDQGRTVPEARAAYQVSPAPTSASAAVTLIGSMETRMLPYLGLWAATAGGDRKSALDSLIETSRQTLSWSGAISVWPGWPPRS